MESSSYQKNTYRELTKIIHIVNSTIQIIHATFSPGNKNDGCKTCQMQHLKQFNRLTTCFTNLSKIQSHCNNKTTSTCRLSLISIKREIIIYRVMSFLPHTTQSMKISLFYLPFPLLMQAYLPVIAVTTHSKSEW